MAERALSGAGIRIRICRSSIQHKRSWFGEEGVLFTDLPISRAHENDKVTGKNGNTF